MSAAPPAAPVHVLHGESCGVQDGEDDGCSGRECRDESARRGVEGWPVEPGGVPQGLQCLHRL
eukprot:14642703-Heterocapsa_arctica.AAC.1